MDMMIERSQKAGSAYQHHY